MTETDIIYPAENNLSDTRRIYRANDRKESEKQNQTCGVLDVLITVTVPPPADFYQGVSP